MIDWFSTFSLAPTTLIPLLVAGIALLIASLTDLKTREVPDLLNYGLVFFGVLLNLSFTVLEQDPRFILESLFGLGIFYALALLMFYTGQWGGGDSKMLMGLGALFGLPLAIQGSFLVSFLLNLLLAGALYGLLWTLGLAVVRHKAFLKEAEKLTRKKIHHYLRIVFLGIALLELIFLVSLTLGQPLVDGSIALLLIFPILIYYLWLFVKGVENACMFVQLSPKQLTEGDWIAEEIKIRGKYVCGPKDLGISKEQIEILQKKYKKKVLVKEGIPFIPSFFLAYVATIVVGNPLVLLFLFV